MFNRKKGVPLVYKCVVWWHGPASDERPRPTTAYGVFQERETLAKAMADKVALKLTSMKGAKPAGPFFATVIEYPRGYFPKTCKCELFFSLGGDDGG